MTYTGILPTWAHRPTITSCDTCGAEVASDHHDLHDTWHANAQRAGFDEGWAKAKAEDSDATRLQRLERQMATVIAHQDRSRGEAEAIQRVLDFDQSMRGARP